MTDLYQIKEFNVPLFPLRYLRSIFNCSKSGLMRKEDRAHLAPANFRGARNHRLYSIEDLALVDYIYKEIWPYKQGVKTPTWVKELVAKAALQAKQVVLQYGKAESAECWKELHKEYTQFDKYRAQLYVDTWRRRLLDCNEFFPELVDEDD